MQVTVAPSTLATANSFSRRLSLPLKKWPRLLIALGVIIISLVLRLHAANLLPLDDDEPTYMRAARVYALHFSTQDFIGAITDPENHEHPPMTKMVYGLILLTDNNYTTVFRRNETLSRDHHQRLFSAIVGSITAGVVTMANPLAGVLVAVNSWHIKYTSEAYLEALPCLFAALMLIVLRRSKRNGDWWWWLAAVLLGLTASGKYLYAVAGVAALIWMVGRSPRSWRLILGWVGVSLLAFYLTDPYLWFDPLGHLWQTVGFNLNYSQGATVDSFGYQWFQPIIWLLSEPHEPVGHLHTFPLPLDGLIFVITVLTLPRLWKQDRLLALWIGVSLLFLFAWPTKWSQYVVIMVVPLAFAIAVQLPDAIHWIVSRLPKRLLPPLLWLQRQGFVEFHLRDS